MIKNKWEKLTWLSYVETRLLSLFSIKNRDWLQDKSLIWNNKANAREGTEPDDNDFRTQIWLTVKLQKDAELLASMPEWTFVPLDGEWRRNRKIIQHIWKYWWLTDNTDKKISDAVQSSTTYGTWFIYEWIKHLYKKTKVPKIKDEDWMRKIEFEDEDRLFYSWIYSELIPFQNVFINWTDIYNSTEAAIVTYYDKDDYINSKELDPNYKNLSNIWPITNNTYSLYNLIWNDFDWVDLDKTVLEIKYYNSAKDEFIVLANWIEVRSSPIPYPHKQIPLVPYIDNKSIERLYWIWEFELTEEEEKYKNELRTLLIKGTKYAIWFILKDSNADIEADDLSAGIWEIYETTDLNGVKQITFNVPIQAISEAESKIDNDIIAKTWVDFRSQGLTWGETATKTASKAQSSRKRINKNIKDNAFSFFRRLAELRMANIQFIHSVWTIEIPIEWGSITAEWVFEPEEWGGYGSAVIWGNFIQGQYSVLPIVETLLWDNKERRRSDAIQYSQLVWNIASEDWKKVIKWEQIARLITEEFNYDFERLTEATEVAKSPDNILKELKKQASWTAWTIADENYVPPEQRRQNTQVPTLSWFSW